MTPLKWACLSVMLLAATALGAFSVAAYRPAAVAASAASATPSPSAPQVILASLGGLQVSGKLTRQAGPWEAPDGAVSAGDAAACPGEETTWYDNSQRPTVSVDLLVARCSSVETARDLQWNRVQATEKSLGPVALPPVVPYAFEGQGTPVVQWPAGQVQLVQFRRGVYFVEATAYVASSRGGDASGLVRRVALAQFQRLTGIPGPGAQSFWTLAGNGLVGGAVAFTLFAFVGWLLVGYVRRWLWQMRARTPGLVTGPGVAAFNVTAAAKRARRTSRWAAISWIAAGVAATEATLHPSAVAAYLAVTFGIAWFAVKVMGRAARPLRPANRPLPTLAEVGWLSLCVIATATAMLSLALVANLDNHALAVIHGRVDPSIVTDEPFWRWISSLPLRLVMWDFCATAAILALAAFACHRRADRAAHPSGAVAASGGETPLAAVSERLRLRTSATGRPTLPERLSLRQFEDFHVVAARLLGAFGRAAGGVHLPGAEFGPGIVPVNAAPPGSYSPDEPELLMFATRQRLADLLLVFPPIPAHEVHARWTIFRERNAVFLPPFVSGDVIGRHADRMLAARWSPERGWYCWHADEKSEWAYAFAFRQAIGALAAPAPSSAYRHPVPVIGYEAGPGVPDFAMAGEPEWARYAVPPAGTLAPAVRRPRRRNIEPVKERRFPGAPRFLRSRKWGVALGGGALAAILALNVVASLITAPGPFDVTAAAAEYLLPAGAVGNGWKPATVSALPSSDLGMLESNGTRCAQRTRSWTAKPDHLLGVELTVCSAPGILADAQASMDDYARGKMIVVGTAGIPYAIETDAPVTAGGNHFQQLEVAFRAGPVLAAVVLLYPGEATRMTPAQVRLVEDTARAQLAELPYEAGPGYGPVITPSLMAQVPRWILSALFWGIAGFSAWSWWIRRRHLARGEGTPPPSTARVSATPVTGRARRAAWLARSRFAIQLVGGYLALASIIAPPPTRYWYLIAGALLLAASPLLRLRGLRRPWSARRRSGVLTGRRTVRALSLVVATAAATVAGIGFAICGLFALTLRSSWTVLPSGRIDRSLLASGSLYRILALEPMKMLTVDFFALAITAVILVPMSYTAARRVAALTADEVTRGGDPEDGPSGREAILYLRNFTDDDIRMPTSRLSRNSIVERIAVYRLERFEEVIVRHLGNFGPVIAVSPPEMEKPPIGAARMNLANTSWQTPIGQYIESARLIVIGAAPEGRTEGLEWELAEIARAGALSKTLLVLPPLRSQTVRERWAIFSAMARDFDLPPELTVGADHQLVLINSGPGGPGGTTRWRTWHSRRRTEWAYAVALQDASRALLGIGT
jgi:hypothetical protein